MSGAVTTIRGNAALIASCLALLAGSIAVWKDTGKNLEAQQDCDLKGRASKHDAPKHLKVTVGQTEPCDSRREKPQHENAGSEKYGFNSLVQSREGIRAVDGQHPKARDGRQNDRDEFHGAIMIGSLQESIA